MTNRRIDMRRIRDALTNHFDRRLSNRRSAEILGLDHTTIGKYLARFVEKGLTYCLPTEMDDATLENLLFSNPVLRSLLGPFCGSLVDFTKVSEDLKNEMPTLTSLHSEWLATVPAERAIGYSSIVSFTSLQKFAAHFDATHGGLWREHLCRLLGSDHRHYKPEHSEVRSAQIFVGVLGGSNYTFCSSLGHSAPVTG